jgi:hypothetical protein
VEGRGASNSTERFARVGVVRREVRRRMVVEGGFIV